MVPLVSPNFPPKTGGRSEEIEGCAERASAASERPFFLRCWLTRALGASHKLCQTRTGGGGGSPNLTKSDIPRGVRPIRRRGPQKKQGFGGRSPHFENFTLKNRFFPFRKAIFR